MFHAHAFLARSHSFGLSANQGGTGSTDRLPVALPPAAEITSSATTSAPLPFISVRSDPKPMLSLKRVLGA